MDLSDRYDRQQRLPQIGAPGQAKLRSATVALLGCGALGSVAAEQLARAGLGRLRLIDRDIVEATNLQRQVLYTESDARRGVPKAVAAERRLRRINSSIDYEAAVTDVTADNVLELIADADVIVDATDNFETRYLLNEAALEADRPWIHGGCVGTGGQVMPIVPGVTACFRCIVPDPPAAGEMATCESAGVLASATAVIASLQVTETLRLIVGGRPTTSPPMRVIDVWDGRMRSVASEQLKNRDCPICVGGGRPLLRGEETSEPRIFCGRLAVSFPPGGRPPQLEALARRWAGMGRIESNRFLVRLSADDFRITLFKDGRVLVEGTNELAQARALKSRYVGG